jgi:hypothetical protein
LTQARLVPYSTPSVAPGVLVRLLPFLLLAGSAFASEAPVEAPNAVEVARGEDLTAWQLLEVRRLSGPEAIAAYRAYVLEYFLSPLALAAWGRLVELGVAEDGWLEEARPLVASVKRRWEVAQRALSETAGRKVVALLDL